MAETKEYKTLSFSTADKFELWLEKNHNKTEGVWMRIFKKGSGKKTVTNAEAIECALCYGWIDGLRKSLDDESYLQKFTPRRAKSVWSKINKAHALRLIREGRMKKAGLEQIAAAKKDGRWQNAYDPPSKMTVPEDFLKELSKNIKAKKFFDTLNKTNLFAIGYRLQAVKKYETRIKKIKTMIEMFANGEKFH